MDNLDDSENNAKISDSAYSNSCSNSQSRSHSSKSTHSGSNCSGSSGYDGKPSTSGSSNKLEQTSKKDKDAKKKKQVQSQIEVIAAVESVVLECRVTEPIPLPEEDLNDVVNMQAEENMDFSASDLTTIKEEMQIATMQANSSSNFETSCQFANMDTEGFSCTVSIHDGVVMYTTHSLTATLGFPKDMWMGRSFIDFVHPKDRNTFASQITNGLVMPEIINGKPDKVSAQTITDCTMVCRIRRYKSLAIGFGVKDRMVTYKTFLLKFSSKDIKDDDANIVYLLIQATPLYSAFKTPNEQKTDTKPFVIRHSAAGNLEYIDIESVPYLGYLPQDIQNNDALLLYHPEDLPYLKMIYETIVKEGSVSKGKPYRMLTQNGDYVKLQTEWSSFINPWSIKLEFVIGKHYILEGPTTPDVFLSPPPVKAAKTLSPEDKSSAQQAEAHRENILKILKDVLTKPAEKARQKLRKRCQELTMIMKSLLEEQPKPEAELRVEIQEPEREDLNSYERDSVKLRRISPHHENNDSKSNTETPLSYNQLNYNENLQRYFESQNNSFDENLAIAYIPDNIISTIESKPSTSKCLMSPPAQNSIKSMNLGSSASSTALIHTCLSPNGDYQPRLTDTLLTKHNNEMEKELAKTHRGGRSSSKGDRPTDARQKKKEHLICCNASFQSTLAGAAESAQIHRVKRHMNTTNEDIAHKRPRHSLRHTTANDATNVPPQVTVTNSVAATQVAWQKAPNSVSIKMNSYGMDMLPRQQISMMTPNMPGLFPMCYGPTAPTSSHLTAAPSTSIQHTHTNTVQDANTQYQQSAQYPQQMMPQQMQPYQSPQMAWMSPPQQVYGSPYMYPQMPYNLQQQALMPQAMNYNQSLNQSFNQSLNPLGLANSNYMQACTSKSSLPPTPKPIEPATWMEIGADTVLTSTNNVDKSNFGDSASIALNRPDLLNEQLGQLYMGLQLEGVASLLTLAEGSSSS